MSKNISTPFRYDFVGSFLRPTELKDARRSFEAGTISAEELKAVEDRCILDLIEKQKKARKWRKTKAFCQHARMWITWKKIP